MHGLENIYGKRLARDGPVGVIGVGGWGGGSSSSTLGPSIIWRTVPTTGPWSLRRKISKNL